MIEALLQSWGFASILSLNLFYFFIFPVPSENKRDLRSIEETLNDIRKRKKLKPDDIDEASEPQDSKDEQ